MYQVLYRKWRPHSFKDVIGQEHVTKTLQNELKLDKVGHAYLFIGSKGTGKTTCAKIFSKAVNCIRPVGGDPCCECDICKGIGNGSIMDVMEMDAASNNGVNDIRAICDEINFTPAIAKYRVYIIDEVHMLSPGAFNALLKTLEEPPDHVIFILATTEVHKIPATILSRCQKFEFYKIPENKICERLKFISKEEGVEISEEAALLVARLSDGALRDALSVLDRCLILSDNITVEVVNNVTGIAGREYILQLINSIVLLNPSAALLLIDEMYSKSKDMMILCEDLISSFRDLMLISTMKKSRDLITCSDNDFEELVEMSKGFSLEKIVDVINVLENSIGKMSQGCNKRIEMETAFVKICSSKFNVNIEEIIKRLEALELNGVFPKKRNVCVDGHHTNDQVFSGEHINRNANLIEITENAVPLKEWPEILNNLKDYSHTISAAFNGSTAYVSGEYVLIDAQKEVAFELLRKSSQREKMRLVIQKVTGKSYKLGPYKKNDHNEPLNKTLNEFIKDATEAGVKVIINE